MDQLAQKERESEKTYEFQLLKKRELYVRMDIFTVAVVTGALFYTFGWRLTDKEDLMAIGLLVLAIIFNGVLLLSNFWSVEANEFFAYAKLTDSDIERCTHVKVRINNKKQNVVKRYIVPLL